MPWRLTPELVSHAGDPVGPGEMLIAEAVHLRDGVVVPCPAAPLLAGTVTRAGYSARLGTLTVLRAPAVEGTAWAMVAVDGRSAASCATRGAHETAFRTSATGLAVLPGPGGATAAAAESALDTVLDAAGDRAVLLASPRSFCAGVERAIDIVKRALKQRPNRDEPLYVRKQIVHNAHVIVELESMGVVFVEELDDVPAGATVVFSAHGVSPAVRRDAARRGLRVIDATCPLVMKVHTEAQRFGRRGDMILLIGHAGHEEVEGTIGEQPARTFLIQDAADAESIQLPTGLNVSYLTQTTLAKDETDRVLAVLKRRFPHLRGPRANDICYASTNRQLAVREVAAISDVLLVVGSANSSNSRRMVEVAERVGCRAHLVDDATHVRAEWLIGARTVGLSAGASAPDALVDDLVEVLGGLGRVTVSQVPGIVEDVHFTLPKEVRGDFA